MKYPQDSKETIKKYSNFLEDKRIIIVGPAPHMIGSNFGEMIDSYDIIVRINKGYKISKDLEMDLGKKVDVLYQTMLPQRGLGITMPIEELKNKIHWVCASFPDEKHRSFINDFIKFNNDKINLHIMDKKYWEGLKNKIDIPHAGTVTIFDLLRYNIKELYITGITFYQVKGKKRSFYYNGYHKKSNKKKWVKGTKHNCFKTFNYFKNILKKDKRIKYDFMIERLLENC